MTNEDRAEAAGIALRDMEGSDPHDQRSNLVDLLTNLRHWAAQEKISIDEAWAMSQMHFKEERDGD